MLAFATVFFIVSTVYIVLLTKGLPGGHCSDFTPDYPGGVAGLTWAVLNAVVWSAAFYAEWTL